MSNIVTKRYLKNRKTINVIVNNERMKELANAISFRHFRTNPEKLKNHTSPKFLQEIVLEDGSKVRVYAKNPEQLEEIKKAIANGEIKLNIKSSEKKEVAGAKIEAEAKPETKVENETPKSEEDLGIAKTLTAEPRAKKPELVAKEESKDYLDDLKKNNKIKPLEEGKEPDSGFKVIEIPFEGTDEKARYQVSLEKYVALSKKVEAGDIACKDLAEENVEAPVETEAPAADGENGTPAGDPKTGEKDAVSAEIEKKEGKKEKEENKGPATPEDVRIAEAAAAKAKAEAEKAKIEDRARRDAERKKNREERKAAKNDPTKPKRHIFRKIMQGLGIAAIAVAGLALIPVAGWLAPVAGAVGAVLAGRGMKHSNEALSKKEKAERQQALKEHKVRVHEKGENLEATKALQNEFNREAHKEHDSTNQHSHNPKVVRIEDAQEVKDTPKAAEKAKEDEMAMTK